MLHREVLKDYPKRALSFTTERDEQEKIWVDLVAELVKKEERKKTEREKTEKEKEEEDGEQECKAFTKECFTLSEELQERWIEKVKEISLPSTPFAIGENEGYSPFYALKWNGFNREAGMLRADGKGIKMPLLCISARRALKIVLAGTFFTSLSFIFYQSK